MKITVYRNVYNFNYGIFCKIPVELTGRWKIIVTNGFPDLYLEIEHKEERIFKTNIEYKWIHENEFLIEEVEEFINECSSK